MDFSCLQVRNQKKLQTEDFFFWTFRVTKKCSHLIIRWINNELLQPNPKGDQHMINKSKKKHFHLCQGQSPRINKKGDNLSFFFFRRGSGWPELAWPRKTKSNRNVRTKTGFLKKKKWEAPFSLFMKFLERENFCSVKKTRGKWKFSLIFRPLLWMFG